MERTTHTMSEQREIARAAYDVLSANGTNELCNIRRSDDYRRYRQPHAYAGFVISVAVCRQREQVVFRGAYGNCMVSDGSPRFRLSVVVQTNDGFLLHGYIGSSETVGGLPDIRIGDAIEVDPVRLMLNGRDHVPGCVYSNLANKRFRGRVRRSNIATR